MKRQDARARNEFRLRERLVAENPPNPGLAKPLGAGKSRVEHHAMIAVRVVWPGQQEIRRPDLRHRVFHGRNQVINRTLIESTGWLAELVNRVETNLLGDSRYLFGSSVELLLRVATRKRHLGDNHPVNRVAFFPPPQERSAAAKSFVVGVCRHHKDSSAHDRYYTA